MAAPRGLEGRINEIASRPTDPNIDQRLDQIRQAEAIYHGGNGQRIEAFLTGLAANRDAIGHEASMSVTGLQVAIIQVKRNIDAQLIASLGHVSRSPRMTELIKDLKTKLVRDEQVANPRRLALLGAISSTMGLPGATTSHPVHEATGATLERNAAGGPTALIAQMIGSRPDGSAPHIRTSKSPPGPPPPRDAADDAFFAGLYDGGRRRTRRTRRRYTRRR